MAYPAPKNKTISALKSIVSVLPSKPGVYQFIDSDGIIIYVGKARNLKKRVASYFKNTYESNKTRILVSKIHDIRHIVVDTETDALLLENNLIKKYRPHYNVLLKDDKSYPWICVKNEPFPRVFQTRKFIRDGSWYFGPYTSVVMVRTLLEIIRQLFPLRNCNLRLTPENIANQKFKVCLQYHIHNCKGPCEGYIQQNEYQIFIDHIKNILKGNINSVIEHLKNQMKQLAISYKFEEAQQLKEKISLLETYQSKSAVVNQRINNVDVFTIYNDKDYAYVNFLKVMNGCVIQVHTLEMKKKIEEEKVSLLELAIVEIKQRFEGIPDEIIVPFRITALFPNARITVPTKGDKMKLLELSERNLKYYLKEKLDQQLKLESKKPEDRILETMKIDLRLKELPVYIECFDNSNIQGTNPVASCVVFRNTKPSKNEYRRFNIKTVNGPDDYASMREIVHRRYSRLMAEEIPLPQLVVIDGGKGQLGAAMDSIQNLGLTEKIRLVSIAKRLEEIYFPGDPVPLYLDKNSETLKIIQQLRNEAHRFGIGFHRDKRSKEMIASELDSIKGIGPVTKQLLLEKYKSVKRIKSLTIKQLSLLIGNAKAEIIFHYFNSSEE